MKTITTITERLSDFIEWVCKAIAGVSVVTFVVIICIQVLGRNVLKLPMIWANDLSVVFFVWSCFFGSAVAVRHRAHYVLEFLPERFVRCNAFLDIVGDLAGIVFFYVMIRYGYDYTIMGLRRFSTSINIPQAYFFACIPLSACFMMWYTLEHLAGDIKRFLEVMGQKGGER